MTNQPIDETKNFLKKGLLFVCGALAFYAICCMVVITGSVIWAREDRKITNANATVTAIVRATEQSQFDFIEQFDEASARWYVGPSAKQYGDVLYSIKNGVYIWDVRKSEGFIFSMNFYKGNNIKDFDVYVDTKFVESESEGAVCAGFAFRKTKNDWKDGEYVFTLCNDGHFRVNYHDKDGWKSVADPIFTNSIQLDDWNRMEISARKGRFLFVINNIEVFKMTDDRIQEGDLALYLEVPGGESATIWFDNFGYQSR